MRADEHETFDDGGLWLGHLAFPASDEPFFGKVSTDALKTRVEIEIPANVSEAEFDNLREWIDNVLWIRLEKERWPNGTYHINRVLRQIQNQKPADPRQDAEPRYLFGANRNDERWFDFGSRLFGALAAIIIVSGVLGLLSLILPR